MHCKDYPTDGSYPVLVAWDRQSLFAWSNVIVLTWEPLVGVTTRETESKSKDPETNKVD